MKMTDMTTSIYKVKCDGKLFYVNYRKKENALKVAQEFADSRKFVDVKVIEYLATYVTEVKIKPLHKK